MGAILPSINMRAPEPRILLRPRRADAACEDRRHSHLKQDASVVTADPLCEIGQCRFTRTFEFCEGVVDET